MTTAALITKLKKRIEQERDTNVLRAIEILLRDDTKKARLERKMTDMALRSNEAIANGETHPWKEVHEELQGMIDKQAEVKPGKRKRA
ncbi:MAG TPA: hypothetical protein PL070_16605 [Flavobacteriales bacterium]|nr:hypothetical protein [Flavobacteriales bacterium]